jgi:Rrf2 family protein
LPGPPAFSRQSAVSSPQCLGTWCRIFSVRITAKADYAVRAALELAGSGEPVKGDAIATAQGIPLKFLENILIDLRHSGIVRSQRGPEGGYWLAKPAGEISVADVIRAVEGPLASVRGESPEELDYVGAAGQLRQVWVALRGNIRGVLETVTLEDIVKERLPKKVLRLTEEPGAWARR